MAKSFLSVPINQIPPTTTVEDDDYIIIESPKKGTRIIRKDDLINSGGIEAGKGLIFEDSSTLGMDFPNITSTGLSATEDQLFVNYGLGLSADAGGKLFVNTTQLLSAGAPSSLVFYDANGLSAVSRSNVSGTVKHIYWASNGALSTIQLEALKVPTIDNSGNPILLDLTQFSIPNQIILNATVDGLSSIAGDDSAMTWNSNIIVVSDTVGRWDTAPNYVSFTGASVSGASTSDTTLRKKSRIVLPAGTYLFDSGYYHIYAGVNYVAAQLKLYNGSTGAVEAVIASSAPQYYPWDKSYALQFANVTPGGTFTVTADGASNNNYLQLDFFGLTTYTVFSAGFGPYTAIGTIKIIKIG